MHVSLCTHLTIARIFGATKLQVIIMFGQWQVDAFETIVAPTMQFRSLMPVILMELQFNFQVTVQ